MPTGPASEPALDDLDAPALPELRKVVERADVRVAIAVVVVGVLAAMAGRADAIGLAATLCIVGIALAVGSSGRVVGQGRVLAFAAAVFAVWLSVRTSSWLVPLDLLACGLLLAGATVVRDRSLLDFGPRRALRACGWLAEGALGAAGFVFGGFVSEHQDRGGRARPIALGLLLAGPLVVVVVILLISADAVFASLFDVGDVDSVAELLFWFVIGAWLIGGLLQVASTSRFEVAGPDGGTLNPATVATVLGSLVAVFAMFTITQAVALSGGADHVIRTEGLTYAEYARTGFFQLLAVAAITCVALGALRSKVHEGDMSRTLVVLFEVVVALTLVIVGVAISRLELYNDEFGLTMLRLYSEGFACWIGAVFVLAAMRHLGVGRSRPWLPPVSIGLALVGLFALNIANPERVVVEHNIDRAVDTGRFDAAYLRDLSDDGLPSVAAEIDRLPPEMRERVRDELCDSRRSDTGPPPSGWTSANRARSQARQALREICRSESLPV